MAAIITRYVDSDKPLVSTEAEYMGSGKVVSSEIYVSACFHGFRKNKSRAVKWLLDIVLACD